MKNDLGEYWKSAIISLSEVSNASEDFVSILADKGVKSFELVDSMFEMFNWIIQQSNNKIVMFHDPDDGNYIYAYNGTKTDLIEMMKNVYDLIRNKKG